jgi:putative membrane protein
LIQVVRKGLFLVLVIIAFVLGTQNPALVRVDYIIASSEVPLASLMSLCVVFGLVLGLLLSIGKITQLNRRIRQQQRVNHSTQAHSSK